MFRWLHKTATLTAAIVSTVIVTGCGGGETQVTDASSTPKRSSICWNSALYVPGFNYSASYQSVGAAQPATLVIDYRVLDRERLGDYPLPVVPLTAISDATKVLGTTTTLTRQSVSFDIVAARTELTVYREAIASRSVSSGTLRSFAPPYTDQKFNLYEGETVHINRQYERTDWYNADQSTTKGLSDRISISFDKLESVQTPAGTFEACKFIEANSDGTRRSTWIVTGKGILAREILCSPAVGSQPSACVESVLTKVSI